MQIIDVGRFARLVFGPAQRREDEGGQNADDGDDHQNFDQSEASPRFHGRTVERRARVYKQIEGGKKLQAPTSKLQRNSKHQTSNFA